MRILFVCGAGYVSGKEIITLSLIEGLRARGHDVHCITSSWGCKEFRDRLTSLKTPQTRMPLGFISKTLSWPTVRMNLDQISKLPRLWNAYRSYLRDFAPDVVVHSTFHHVIVLWPLLNARNTLFHVHDPFLQTSFYRMVFRILNRRIRFFVGVSNFIREMIVELGVPAEKVLAVLNGIDLSLDEAPGGTHASGVPERMSTPEECVPNTMHPNGNHRMVKVGIVGQIGDWKGHDDFIEALNGLKQSEVPFQATIFGNGDESYVTGLKKKIAQYDLNQQVRWAGFVKERSEIFAATDICVVPSRSEDPCPTVAIEAAHCGVPLIVTKRGGLPELVRDGETGYLVDACAPAQITQRLKLLIEDSALRLQLSRAAREHGRRQLTQERMVSEMEKILKLVKDNRLG